jgi:hypothetical protein
MKMIIDESACKPFKIFTCLGFDQSMCPGVNACKESPNALSTREERIPYIKKELASSPRKIAICDQGDLTLTDWSIRKCI